MDMKAVDPRSVLRQAENSGFHKHTAGLLVKLDNPCKSDCIPCTPESGNRSGPIVLFTQYAHLTVSICEEVCQGSFRSVQLLSETEPSINTACSDTLTNPQAL